MICKGVLKVLAKVQLMLVSQNAMLLNGLFGALFAGPLLGAWSDRARTRYGRRIPFLMGTTPLVALGIAGTGACRTVGSLGGRAYLRAAKVAD